MTRTRATHFALFLLLLVTGYSVSFATPHVSPEELDQQLQAHPRSFSPEHTPLFYTNELNELDEYEYVLRMVEALDFMASLQVTDQGADFGGMMEGEQDLDIIQTDNTQEALRDWSYFGRLSGDTTRYRDNIDAAWEYILNFPAYDEEGDVNPYYYRVHNCGWGLMATMEYMETYGDSTYLWYGDSCASYIDTYRLPINGNAINPLAAGYGAGTLYIYGVWRQNQDWIDAAQEIATDVQGWIEADPSRLHNYETWAMSAGTAMWGVVTALYRDDHEAGAEWIPQFVDSLDVYSGVGNWNNSWTVWYGHAWTAIHSILDDPQSLANAHEVVDFLLDQDEPDRDGGIPATEGIHQNDQSWTTAYMVWYTMEPIIAETNPQYDATLLSLDNHDPDWPLFQDDTFNFDLTIGNSGLYPLDSIIVQMQYGPFTFADTVDLEFGQYGTVHLEPGWMPDETSDVELEFTLIHPDDGNPANNTLNVTYNVLPVERVAGMIYDPDSTDGVLSRLDAYLYWNESDSLYRSIENDTTGEFSGMLGRGTYRLEFVPLAPPYTPRVIDSLEINEGGVDDIEIELTRAPLLLVLEDGNGDYERYYTEVLDSLDIDTYIWKSYEYGIPDDTIKYFHSVIWSCGDLDDHILAMSNWSEINSFLQEGGSILLTGQNIQDKWHGFSILRNGFRVDEGTLGITGDPSLRILHGVDGDTVVYNDSLIIFGINGGANNQVAPDEAVPADNEAMPILYYGHSDSVAAVAFQHPEIGYHTVFCGFGVEAINSQPPDGYITRVDFLRRVLAWFELIDDTVNVQEPGSTLLPTELALKTWPNPFNHVLRLEVALPMKSEVEIKVFDILGREVAAWEPRTMSTGLHRFTWNATNLASGTYFVRIRTQNQQLVKKALLLK